MDIRREVRSIVRTIIPELGDVRVSIRHLGLHIAGMAVGTDSITVSAPSIAWAAREQEADRGRRVQRVRAMVHAVAVHEAAHLTIAAMNPAAARAAALQLAEFPRPPWADHEVPFLRAVLHLEERASRAGIRVWLDDLLPADYCLSHPICYREALRREIADRIAEPLTSILATPAPRALEELFAEDVAYYQEQQQRGSDQPNS